MRATMRPIHLLAVLLSIVAAGLLLSIAVMPITAQDQPPFPTNTPRPTAVPTLVPDAPPDRYALRLWLEPDLLNLLIDYIRRLQPGDLEGQRAVQMIQHELVTRFPGAPHNPAQRENLLNVMLQAPRGMVDMRDVVRRWAEGALNSQPVVDSFQANGFRIDVTPGNVNGDGIDDALLHITYPAMVREPDELIYDDYVLAVADSGGNYRIVDSTPSYPAAPFGTIETVSLLHFTDVNDDGLDEMVVIVRDDDVNRRMMIFGWRNGTVISLVQPDTQLRFGTVVNWPVTNPEIVGVPEMSVRVFSIESPEWGCVAQLLLQWRYSNNFFRPFQPDLNPTSQSQDSLACRLYSFEPLFSIAPAEAITIVEEILSDYPPDEPGYLRGQMVLAMLYLLDGQPTNGLETAQRVLTVAEPGSWGANQATAFLDTMGFAGTQALDVCEALVQASLNNYPACDIDAVVGYGFMVTPLVTDEPLTDQLIARGLPIIESVPIVQVGRRDRVAYNFLRAGMGWWAFAAQPDGTYLAEQIDAPEGFGDVFLPAGLLDAPQTAYTALLVFDNPSGSLSMIETAVRANPQTPLSPSARYLQAVSYDLAGNRAQAREAYYSLWAQYTNSIWGQLAARHLEQR